MSHSLFLKFLYSFHFFLTWKNTAIVFTGLLCISLYPHSNKNGVTFVFFPPYISICCTTEFFCLIYLLYSCYLTTFQCFCVYLNLCHLTCLTIVGRFRSTWRYMQYWRVSRKIFWSVLCLIWLTKWVLSIQLTCSLHLLWSFGKYRLISMINNPLPWYKALG